VRFLAGCVGALMLLFASADIARAGARVALVIGNGAYGAIPTLANPPNDAEDVAAELRILGFNVMTGVDLDQTSMEHAIVAFARAAASAEVSLFYYGGHGLQVAGHNFLIPVDFQLLSEADIYRHTVPLDAVLKALEQSNGVHLVFLDACRTNALKNPPASARTEGLARVGNAAGFLVAFATQPDNVTFDGAGRNSPFAKSLLRHLGTVGQTISDMMIDVRNDVIAMTAGNQIPWEDSSLTRQFYFAPGEMGSGSADTLLWQLLPISFGPGQSTQISLGNGPGRSNLIALGNATANSPAKPQKGPGGRGHGGGAGHGPVKN
jgi:uncharacterized caspase-like protein